MSRIICNRSLITLKRTISAYGYSAAGCNMSDSAINALKRPHEEDHNNGTEIKHVCTDSNKDDIKFRRKKMMLLLGYCGKEYLGMQRNPGFKTIEEDLIKALYDCQLVNEMGYNQLQSVFFQRAARTDKGVSAARQVVSLKLPDNTRIEEINNLLPECIRVFGIKRVTKGFNSKSNCDARTYSYTIPTFAFAPDLDAAEDYRITEDVIEKISQALNIFTGTHNFHNFTSKKKARDPSAIRYIIMFECGRPFISKNVEFVELRVKGQSFMLHQIRKMVGTAIAIVKGLTDAETIKKAWLEARLDLPVAPGLGLVLEDLHYDRYNAKYGKDHEQLTWDEYEAEVKAFKEKQIFPVIVDTEISERSMYNWIQSLPLHTFDIRETHEARKPPTIGENDEPMAPVNQENGSSETQKPDLTPPSEVEHNDIKL